MTSSSRSYSELSKLKTFAERFEYLKLSSEVGTDTFGFDRYMNQQFYTSKEWKRIRNKVILRDSDGENCFDMGTYGYPINGQVVIHHMNPIQVKDISDYSKILDPEYLICVSSQTHKAIHYGKTEFTETRKLVERKPNDTCPWKE